MGYKRISAIPVAEGGTGILSATAYSVVCAGTTSTGVFQPLASLGSSGYLLTSNGASALPSFQAASGSSGALVLIQTQTVSGASAVNFTSGITSTYNNYLLIYNTVTCASNGNCLVQLSINGGSSYIATSYASTDAATTGLGLFTFVNSAGYVFAGSTYLFNLTSAASRVFSTNSTSVYTGSASSNTTTAAVYTVSAVTVNALRVIDSGSTVISGTFSLYGYTK